MEHKFITIGEIMLRLTPPDYEKIRLATTFEARYGGSEANVALSLANLGVDQLYYTFIFYILSEKIDKNFVIKSIEVL